MLRSKEGQSIALGIAMLVVWTAATVHVHSGSRGQNVASNQVDVLAAMAHVESLPVEALPSQP
jgi:hypothetical protein